MIGGCSFENSADLAATAIRIYTAFIYHMNHSLKSKQFNMESDQAAPDGAVGSGSTLLALKTFKMQQEGDEFICAWQ